jgi:hypothetical protein
VSVPLLDSLHRFECPNCTAQLELDEPADRPVLHPCRGLKGLLAPMVPEGTDCKVEAHEREDYVGTDLVRTDGDGRPVMNVTTTYADGRTDVVAFAPTVPVDLKEYR